MKVAEVQKNLRQLLGDIKSKEGLAIVLLVALFYGWFPDSIKDLLGELLPNEWVSLILLVLSILILLIVPHPIEKYSTGRGFAGKGTISSLVNRRRTFLAPTTSASSSYPHSGQVLLVYCDGTM